MHTRHNLCYVQHTTNILKGDVSSVIDYNRLSSTTTISKAP